jgi:crotonobetainyl-CoA:carnitine CoA-transferase CaiB-like acyl-CoA transferase
MEDVIGDSQIAARGMIKPTMLASGKEVRTWGVPFRIDGRKPTRLLAVPGIDQHRDEILGEIGRTTK